MGLHQFGRETWTLEAQTTPLAKARMLLETQGHFPAGVLPGDISDSWTRSLGRGLDPLSRPEQIMSSASEFSVTREKYGNLIRFARPEIELLYDQIAGSNFMIALGSPDGTVLETLTDTVFAETEAGRSVVAGSVWNEELRGTNALGLCVATLRPAQVYGGEHFLRAHSDVSCISSPMFDGRGGLAGVLDASSGANVRQQHTAALVQMSASNIENCLIRAGHEDRIILQFHPRAEYLNTLSVGMLVLDDDFTIHAVNRKGTMFLTGINAILGMPFDHIFENSFETVATRLLQGETLRLRDRFGSAVTMRCVANRASFMTAGRNSILAAPNILVKARKNIFDNLVVEDEALRHAISGLPEAAVQGHPICFAGEPGTGKRTFAQTVHNAARTGQPFVSFDGATVEASKAHDIIFGSTDSPGLLHEASGGTVYIANAACLPLAVQLELARLFQSGEFRHARSGLMIKTDVLLICGLSVPSLVSGLAPQLKNTISNHCISLPPLRARTDLGALALAFVKKSRADADFEPDLVGHLSRYNWPGNLHELNSVMSRATGFRPAGMITGSDILKVLPSAQKTAAPCPHCIGVPWKELQCISIQRTVLRRDRNISRAARELGMSRTTVYKHFNQI